MKIKLNCHNLFTYFLFHRNDKRLSKEDQKTAKLVSILFAFTLIGHAICRLFFYKEIKTSPTGSAKDKTQSLGKQITSKQASTKESQPPSDRESGKLSHREESKTPLKSVHQPSFNEKQFSNRFPSYRYMNDPVKERDASDIRLLNDSQVADYWQYFTDIHVSYLSDEQIKHLPLDAFQGKKDLLDGLFYAPQLNREEATRKMALLSSEQITAYWELFGKNIELISKEQLQNLDPALSLDPYFEYLFPELDQEVPTTGSKIQWLTMEQIARYWHLFDTTRISYLSDEQMQKLDYDLFSASHGKTLAAALFPPNNSKK